MFYFTNFLIGTCLASHIGVISDRFLNKDFLFTRSKCNYCNFELSLLDEIPLLSYLLLKGHCRFCKNPIPIQYFLLELIGGWAFIKIDFSNLNNISLVTFLFYLLLIAYFDYQNQEFPTIFLLPLIYVATCQWNQNIHNYGLSDIIEFLPIFLILIFFVLTKKFGSGDLIIYLLIVLFWNPHFANIILLIATILALIQYSIEIKNRNSTETFPFVPYIYLALIFSRLYL